MKTWVFISAKIYTFETEHKYLAYAGMTPIMLFSFRLTKCTN